MTHNNGTNLIIDALLTRMSELDRFSDGERVIANRELLPLDVVVDENGNFGFATEVEEYGFDENGNKRWCVEFVGYVGIITQKSPRYVRTIYETEGLNARACITKHLGGDKWH